MNIITSAIGQGLLWSLLGVGLFLTFRILNFPDMTIEGTFPLGGVVSVILIEQGLSPILTLIFATVAGSLGGLLTGLLYTKGKIPILLAGILTMTALYSINLLIMSGKSNVSLLGQANLFESAFFNQLPPYMNAVVIGGFAIILIILILMWFLNTQLGQTFIATGDNPIMARSFGIPTDQMIITGLMISNGIIALAGALISQNDGFADVNKGIGTIVIALAAIILGEVLFSGTMPLYARLITIVFGAIIYRFVLVIVLALGLDTNYLKIFSAIILALALMLPTFQNKFRTILGGLR